MSGLCGRIMCTLSFSQRGRQPEEVTGSPPGYTKKSPDLASEDSILVRDTGIEPARGRIFRAREAPINLSLAEGVSPRRSLVLPRAHKKSPDLPSEDSILVRDTGIEPVTSSVSGKRATAAPIALTKQLFCCEVRTGFEPAYTALQAAA